MDSVGVFLWANRAQYAEVSFQTISDNDIADVGLPTMQEDMDEDGSFIPSFFYLSPPSGSFRDVSYALVSMPVSDGPFDPSVSDLIGPQSLDSSQQPEDVFASPDQLAGELATLTLLPRSRWQTLLKLEVIQVGNDRPHLPAPRTNLNYIPRSTRSNGTNQKSLRSRWRRRRSSCLHFQASNTDSRCKRRRTRPRKRRSPLDT